MPTTVSVVTGHASAALTAGEHFVWVNTSATAVELTYCGAFCTASSYSVAAQAGAQPGETAAQINSAPSGWTFTENPPGVWNPGGPVPGNPRIQNPSKMADREVA